MEKNLKNNITQIVNLGNATEMTLGRNGGGSEQMTRGHFGRSQSTCKNDFNIDLGKVTEKTLGNGGPKFEGRPTGTRS